MASIRVVNFSETLRNFLVRFSVTTLDRSNENSNWHVFIWPAGSTLHCARQIRRSSSQVKVHGISTKMLLVVGATSSEGFFLIRIRNYLTFSAAFLPTAMRPPSREAVADCIVHWHKSVNLRLSVASPRHTFSEALKLSRTVLHCHAAEEQEQWCAVDVCLGLYGIDLQLRSF